MASKNTKPCPTCEGGIIHRPFGARAWPPICAACDRLIDKGRAAEAAEDRRKKLEDYSIPDPQRGRWQIASPGNSPEGHRILDELRRAIPAMLAAICEPATEQGGYGGDIYHYLPAFETGFTYKVRLNKTQAETIRKFHKVLQKALAELHQDGLKDGRNMLKQLATGTISTEEFDSVERGNRN